MQHSYNTNRQIETKNVSNICSKTLNKECKSILFSVDFYDIICIPTSDYVSTVVGVNPRYLTQVTGNRFF
jgi:hypothetical protein